MPPQKPLSRRPLGAFTLIELLTVIAIIGILAAIIFPTVGVVRKKSANTRDTANLRQIGIAIQLHASENKGMLPNRNVVIPGTVIATSPGDRWTFHEAVERYLGDNWKRNPGSIYNYLGNDIWTSLFAEPYDGFVPVTANNQTRPLAYGFNDYIHNSRWQGRTVAIPRPPQTVLMAEVNGRSSISMSQSAETRPDVETGYRVSRDGRALYLFADYRVEMLEGDLSEAALLASGKPNIWRWWP